MSISTRSGLRRSARTIASLGGIRDPSHFVIEVFELVLEVLGDGRVILGDEDLLFAETPSLGAAELVLQGQNVTGDIHRSVKAPLVPTIQYLDISTA
jgi:hypothetical protein